MNDVSRLVIPARLEEVRHACSAVVKAAKAASLDERAVYHCQMAVDEALTNIIEHGYTYQANEHQIEVICQIDSDHFLITITDDSPAFNPLEHFAPDPAAPLDSREPGGWGIYFIRKLMDDVRYRYEAGRNHLTLIKNRPHKNSQPDPVEETEETFPVRTLDSERVIIQPAGRLDSNSSPILEKTLAVQMQKGYRWLLVDMGDVDYIASSGLKVLVSAWRRSHERHGDVFLYGLQPRISEVIEMVGFDTLFEIFPDLDSALSAPSQTP